jgi:hypothetical protein
VIWPSLVRAAADLVARADQADPGAGLRPQGLPALCPSFGLADHHVLSGPAVGVAAIPWPCRRLDGQTERTAAACGRRAGRDQHDDRLGDGRHRRRARPEPGSPPFPPHTRPHAAIRRIPVPWCRQRERPPLRPCAATRGSTAWQCSQETPPVRAAYDVQVAGSGPHDDQAVPVDLAVMVTAGACWHDCPPTSSRPPYAFGRTRRPRRSRRPPCGGGRHRDPADLEGQVELAAAARFSMSRLSPRFAPPSRWSAWISWPFRVRSQRSVIVPAGLIAHADHADPGAGPRCPPRGGGRHRGPAGLDEQVELAAVQFSMSKPSSVHFPTISVVGPDIAAVSGAVAEPGRNQHADRHRQRPARGRPPHTRAHAVLGPWRRPGRTAAVGAVCGDTVHPPGRPWRWPPLWSR